MNRKARRNIRTGQKPEMMAAAAQAAGGIPLVGQGIPVPLADKAVQKRYTPLRDDVVCWIEPGQTKTKSGLEIVGKGLEHFVTPIGHVIAVGPETKWVKPGDRVLLLATTVAVKVFFPAGEATVVVSESKISGIIDKEQPVDQAPTLLAPETFDDGKDPPA